MTITIRFNLKSSATPIEISRENDLVQVIERVTSTQEPRLQVILFNTDFDRTLNSFVDYVDDLDTLEVIVNKRTIFSYESTQLNFLSYTSIIGDVHGTDEDGYIIPCLQETLSFQMGDFSAKEETVEENVTQEV